MPDQLNTDLELAAPMKARMDLIPLGALMDTATTMSQVKHKERDYLRDDYKWGDHLGAALRHLTRWQEKEGVDTESGKSHLAHAAARILMLLDLERKGVGIDNRP